MICGLKMDFYQIGVQVSIVFRFFIVRGRIEVYGRILYLQLERVKKIKILEYQERYGKEDRGDE